MNKNMACQRPNFVQIKLFRHKNSCKPNILDGILPGEIGINIASYVWFPEGHLEMQLLSLSVLHGQESRGSPSRHSRSRYAQDTWGARGGI